MARFINLSSYVEGRSFFINLDQIITISAGKSKIKKDDKEIDGYTVQIVTNAIETKPEIGTNNISFNVFFQDLEKAKEFISNFDAYIAGGIKWN